MIVECGNCGAPLDADGTAAFVKCKYCEISNRVASLKTLSTVTPAGWQPPSDWKPSAGASNAVAVAAAGTAAATGATGCVAVAIVIVAVLAIVAGVGAAIWSRAPASERGAGVEGGLVALTARWDGRAPFRCSGDDRIELEGISASLPMDTAVLVGGNCELVLTACEIRARQGIEVRGSGRVVLRRSTLVTSGDGIDAGARSAVVLESSTIEAGGIGVNARLRAHVTVSGGRVSGTPTAVTTAHHATLDVRGGELIDVPFRSGP